MSRSLFCLLAVIVPVLTSGCNSCVNRGYYDPCGGMVYGPSLGRPTLKGLFKKKHDSEHCLLCQSENESDRDCGCGSSSRSKHSDCGCSGGKHRSKNRDCGCSKPVGHTVSSGWCCGGEVWGGPVYGGDVGWGSYGYVDGAVVGSSCSGCGAPAGAVSGCSGCGAPAPSTGCSGCGAPAGASTPGCSGCSGGLSYGESTHNHSGSCAACNGAASTSASGGPLFQNEVVPGQVNGGGDKPAPAPAAEESESTGANTPPPPEENSTSVNPASGLLPSQPWSPTGGSLPEPRRLSTNAVMMIPTVPARDGTQQTHWIPSDLK